MGNRSADFGSTKRNTDLRIVRDVPPTPGPLGWFRPGLVLRSDDTYVVGREKVREFARVILATDPAHHDVEAARRAGYANIVAPPTSWCSSTPRPTCVPPRAIHARPCCRRF
ncbi:FAS1-like dehydratase domain-containing protein [Rhodococcus sp. ACT016]|uniref:FAS1-like dehydratase domain-containing protein n=1 Tax=Rhodococcus sp. ACT016 TaxID=3134808 RepID=UPI003D27730A